MSHAGGFNWTKFINNKKFVLMSIPDNYKREVVKDSDLVNEDLSTEKSLRVQWNIRKKIDQPCFKLNLKTGNIAGKSMLSTLRSF